MRAYMIARIAMTEPDTAKADAAYAKYREEGAPAYAKHDARFLVRGGAIHASEGEHRARNVVIEFPSIAVARAWHGSEVYDAAAKHRRAVSEGDMVVVEGVVRSEPALTATKGYWIARVDVHDEEGYRPYVEESTAAFATHGAVFLARGGPYEVLEGKARKRNVLIEFPSVKEAMACYNSDVYQRASKHRRGAGTGEIVIVEGV